MVQEISPEGMARLSHASIVATDVPVFHKDKHISYFLRCLRTPLPHHYMGSDTNRLSLVFFTICALDLLGVLFDRTTNLERKTYTNWIYECQSPDGGFSGAPRARTGDQQHVLDKTLNCATMPGTYFALSTLCILEDDLTRLDRRKCLSWLSKMQRSDGSFGELQDHQNRIQGGTDSRFGYFAMALRWMIRGPSGRDEKGLLPDFNVKALIQCVRRSRTFDGGIADEPFHEAHAGFTFCGIAAFSLNERSQRHSDESTLLESDNNASVTSLSSVEVDYVKEALGDHERTVHWLVSRLTTSMDEEDQMLDDDESDTFRAQILNRPEVPPDVLENSQNPSFIKMGSFPAAQQGRVELDKLAAQPDSVDKYLTDEAGYNGRSNKVADTCYAFWVGASLSILGHADSIDPNLVRKYLLERTQHSIAGGFGKLPGDPPDIYHSCLALAALSLTEDEVENIAPIDAAGGDFANSNSALHQDTRNTNRNPRVLKALDPSMCFSVQAKKWVEHLEWHRNSAIK